MRDVLVVYYSRTGTTRRVADAIASLGGWDTTPIVDARSRRGLLGYLRAGLDAWLGRRTRIGQLQADLADYRLVVVGGPIWNGRVTPAVRTFLADHRDRLGQVAFFLTCGGRGQKRVLEQMRALAGKDPVATLALTDRDAERHLAERARMFVEGLREIVGTPATAAPEHAPPPPA